MVSYGTNSILKNKKQTHFLLNHKSRKINGLAVSMKTPSELLWGKECLLWSPSVDSTMFAEAGHSSSDGGAHGSVSVRKVLTDGFLNTTGRSKNISNITLCC